jgi:hypothetical protein
MAGYCSILFSSYVTRHRASKIRKFSYLSRVTGVEYENRQNVTKSLKITPKIEISAYTVARAVAFARAAFVDSIGLIGVFNPSKISAIWTILTFFYSLSTLVHAI